MKARTANPVYRDAMSLNKLTELSRILVSKIVWTKVLSWKSGRKYSRGMLLTNFA